MRCINLIGFEGNCPSSHDFKGSGRSSWAHLLQDLLFLAMSTKSIAQEDYVAAKPRLRILLSEPIDTPPAALILKFLNSWGKLAAAQVRKFSHSKCKRLLYFFLDLLWHVLKCHLSLVVGRGRLGKRRCRILSYTDREVRCSQCQDPPTSLLGAWLSQGQRAGQGEKEKWLQPLAGVKEFGGCIWEQGELPTVPRLLPSVFLWAHRVSRTFFGLGMA